MIAITFLPFTKTSEFTTKTDTTSTYFLSSCFSSVLKTFNKQNLIGVNSFTILWPQDHQLPTLGLLGYPLSLLGF